MTTLGSLITALAILIIIIRESDGINTARFTLGHAPTFYNSLGFELRRPIHFMDGYVELKREIRLPAYQAILKNSETTRKTLDDNCRGLRNISEEETRKETIKFMEPWRHPAEARSFCSSLGGTLPDGKTAQNRQAIVKVIAEANIDMVPLNIFRIQGRYMYGNTMEPIDKDPEFQNIKYHDMARYWDRGFQTVPLSDAGRRINEFYDHHVYITRHNEIVFIHTRDDIWPGKGDRFVCDFGHGQPQLLHKRHIRHLAQQCEASSAQLSVLEHHVQLDLKAALLPLRSLLINRGLINHNEFNIQKVRRTIRQTNDSIPGLKPAEIMVLHPNQTAINSTDYEIPEQLPLQAVDIMQPFDLKAVSTDFKLREKRVAGLVWNVATFVYDLHESYSINAKVDGLHAQIIELEGITKAVTSRQNVTQSMINALTTAINTNMIALRGQSTIDQINTQFRDDLQVVRDSINVVREQIKAITEQRASIALLRPSEIDMIENQLSDYLKGGKLIRKYGLMDIELDTVEGSSLFVNIRIPIQEAIPWGIVRIHALPDLKKGKSPLVGETLFAVSNDQTKFFYIQEHEYQRCLQTACSKTGLIQMTADNRCGPAQYVGRPGSKCKWEDSPTLFTAQRTDSGFVFASKNRTKIVLLCNKATIAVDHIEHMGYMQIPDGCSVTIHWPQATQMIEGPPGRVNIQDLGHRSSLNAFMELIPDSAVNAFELVDDTLEGLRNTVKNYKIKIEDNTKILKLKPWTIIKRIGIIVSIVVAAVIIIMAFVQCGFCHYMKKHVVRKSEPKLPPSTRKNRFGTLTQSLRRTYNRRRRISRPIFLSKPGYNSRRFSNQTDVTTFTDAVTGETKYVDRSQQLVSAAPMPTPKISHRDRINQIEQMEVEDVRPPVESRHTLLRRIKDLARHQR